MEYKENEMVTMSLERYEQMKKAIEINQSYKEDYDKIDSSIILLNTDGTIKNFFSNCNEWNN